MTKVTERTIVTVKAPGRERIWVECILKGDRWTHGDAYTSPDLEQGFRAVSSIEFVLICKQLEELGW